MSAACLIPNCGKRAPKSLPFCAEHRAAQLQSDGSAANAEFVAVWMEAAQCWRVIIGDGYVLPASFPAIGYAANAAYDFLKLGESDFEVTEDTGTFYRYQRDLEPSA